MSLPTVILPALSAAPGIVLATTSVTGDQIDLAQLVVGSLVGLVGLVVGYIAWHRREMRLAIQTHERIDRAERKKQHEEVMGALRMLVQRLVDRGVLPESSPSGSWPILTPAPVRPRRDDDTEDG